jgi:quercetin dioxygenase-like cupin family protein
VRTLARLDFNCIVLAPTGEGGRKHGEAHDQFRERCHCIHAIPARCRCRRLEWCKQLSPDDYSLRLVLAQVDESGSVSWTRDHGDEGIYILSGALDVDGHMCPQGGAIIVESGVQATVRAKAASTFVHTAQSAAKQRGSGPLGPPQQKGHQCHVVGPDGWHQSGNGTDFTARWFADGSCPTWRISLFRVDHQHGFAGDVHSHSEDEIIYVLEGSVRLGKREYGQGTAVCIAANTRYRVSYPRGGDFLNYRADVSEHRIGDRTPTLETALAQGGRVVADFR